MEMNFQDISFSLLVSTLLMMSYLYFKEQKITKHLHNELDRVNGQRTDGIYGKAKFSELGLMSAGIAHEINNPLSIIQTKTTHLLRIYKNPEGQRELAKGLKQIQYTSERIARTVKGIRDYIYQDDHEYDGKIPLKSLLENVMVFCAERLRNHGVELRIKNVDDIYLKGHRVQLEQAILNLINNAFDAIDNRQPKWIQISAIEEKENIQIFFKDSGSGIPIEVRTKMMEPFYTTKKDKGTGLGLPLVQGIAQKHGGKLCYVEGTHHTTFLLELPKST